MIGLRFGRLVVVSLARLDGVHRYWNCQCDCGELWAVRSDNLQRGATKSCGCLRADVRRKAVRVKATGRYVSRGKVAA